jgi:hypothetical protein
MKAFRGDLLSAKPAAAHPGFEAFLTGSCPQGYGPHGSLLEGTTSRLNLCTQS